MAPRKKNMVAQEEDEDHQEQLPKGVTHQLSGDIAQFKSVPSEVRAHIMQDCTWRSTEWFAHARPIAPPEHADRIRSAAWVVPHGPTEEEIEAARRAEVRREKLLQSDRLKKLIAMIGGNTLCTMFLDWRRNVKRARTYKFGKARMTWIYARFTAHGRFLSRAYLGWWSHATYQTKMRNLIIAGCNRWRDPEACKALNRWKEWLDIKHRGMDLIRRVAKRMMNQGLTRCFGAWVEMMREKEEQQEKIKKMLAIMLGNAFQYYFSTWRENARFLGDPYAQMGDKEVLAVFYAVGNATINKRIAVKSPRDNGQEQEREYLVELGSEEAWLPRSALAVVGGGSRPGTGESRRDAAIGAGALVKLVEKKKKLKLAFKALGGAATVEFTDEKGQMCGRVGEVVAPDMGDGTLNIDFSGPGGEDGSMGRAGWYPASAVEVVRPARGASVETTASMAEGELGVGSKVRVRGEARAALPVDVQVSAGECHYIGVVLAAPDGSPRAASRGGLGAEMFGTARSGGGSSYGGGGSYYSGVGGSYSDGGSETGGSVVRLGSRRTIMQFGRDYIGGGDRKERRSDRRRSAGRRSSRDLSDGEDGGLPGLDEGGRSRRRKGSGGGRREKRKAAKPKTPELFELHLDRPLSRVRDNLGMHYSRKAAHVLNSPQKVGDKGMPGAPSQIVGLRMKSLWGAPGDASASGGGVSSGEMLRADLRG